MAELYHGPQCPHCKVTLGADLQHTGTIVCPHCDKDFEATAFAPAAIRVVAPEIVGVGPEEGTACANHARNAAVASCHRCGLFICSLCEMNTGTGTFCPSCFDRIRTEDSAQVGVKRYRNYTSFAFVSVAAGVLMWFLCIPLGAVGIYYGVKDIRQRRERKVSIAAPIFVILLALAEVIGGITLLGFFVYAMVNA